MSFKPANVRSDDVSLRMRIPADKCFFENATLALEGVCEHFSVEQGIKERIKKTLESSMAISVDFFFKSAAGLLEFEFLANKNSLEIKVENCLLSSGQDLAVNTQAASEKLDCEIKSADSFSLCRKASKGLCYSIAFNFSAKAS